MSSDQIFKRIRQHLVQEFELNSNRITLESDLFDDLNLDSIDALDLIATLESELGEEVPEKLLAKIRLVKDVVNLVEYMAKAKV